jgi:TPR repeat protein
MNKDDRIHQQNIFDSTGLLPKRHWKTAIWHVALLVVVVFLTEISGAQADMVFDFQMKLAQKGNAEAQFKVGEMYETGRGVEKNIVEAKRWITRAAEQGHQAANYKLLYYDLQNNGVTAKNKPKLAELQQAAKGGNGIAQYYVGLMHSRGVGLRRNSTVALDWLGKASTLGVTAAEAEIAHINEARSQYQLRAKQDAERKAREQEEAKRQEEEERRKVAAQREAEKRKQQQAATKKKAEQNQKAARQREAERIAAEERAKQERLIAQREAEAEQKRQAVLKQREEKEAKKKAQFESDPCAGKSARFLSTCR